MDTLLIDVWPSALFTLAATPGKADAPFVLAGVLLTLVVIYIASKLGAELSKAYVFRLF